MPPRCFTHHKIAPSRPNFAEAARLTSPPSGQCATLRFSWDGNKYTC